MTASDDFSSGNDSGPTENSEDEILRLHRSKEAHHRYGNMDRTQFEYAVFTKAIDEWPIGHLLDHRVSAPESLINFHLGSTEAELAKLLNRFLSESSRKGAREMIAEALKLEPQKDARALIEIRDAQPEIFKALLRGRLGEIWMEPQPSLGTDAASELKASPMRWATVKAAMRLMLLYYGALDLQLIAARSRNFDDFYHKLGVTSAVGETEAAGSEGRTTGKITVSGWMNHVEEVYQAGIYAEQTANDRRPAGRTPKKIAELKHEGRILLKQLGIDEKTGSLPPKMLAFLNEQIAKLAEEGLPAIDEFRSIIPDFSPDASSGSRRRPIGGRAELKTLLENLTVGEQIGFASFRLANLVVHVSRMLPEKGVEQKYFAIWNDASFGKMATDIAHKLYYVHQAETLQNAQTCMPNLLLEAHYENWRSPLGSKQQNAVLKKVAKRFRSDEKGRTLNTDRRRRRTGREGPIRHSAGLSAGNKGHVAARYERRSLCHEEAWSTGILQ
jgi:hypothetical protein